MAKFPDLFSADILSLLFAGEEAGQLARVCKRIGVAQKKSSKTLKKLKGAMIYPAAVITVAVGIVSFIMIFIIPKFKKIFEDFDTFEPCAILDATVPRAPAASKIFLCT
jgi:type II secretory pathway component PulF